MPTNEKPKHSPGPWLWDTEKHQHSGALLDGEGNCVLFSQCDSVYDDDLPTSVQVPSASDARPTAATPEMLELLRRWDDNDGCGGTPGHEEATCLPCATVLLLGRINGDQP